MSAADFYTGIVAELYSSLKAASYPWEPYAALIDRVGQPALELGCGDGEPMLELLRRGYDVDGVDSSAQMLDRFRVQAHRDGIAATLFCQQMENLNLPRTYQAIFLAGPTITLLPDDQSVRSALIRIRRHLTPQGQALVPLFVPAPTPMERIGAAVEHQEEDQTLLRVTTVRQERDEATRQQHTVLRYEKHAADETTIEDRTWSLHWHTPEGFEKLATQAGLRVVDRTGDPTEIGKPGSEWTTTLALP